MAQIMISYRAVDTGSEEQGGDNYVSRVQQHLEELGFKVFVAESVLEGGSHWSADIQSSVVACQVFIMLCSPGYGENKWTFNEYQLAEYERKVMIPLWHSGNFPPTTLKIVLSTQDRIPRGEKPMIHSDFRYCMKQLQIKLAQVGCRAANKPVAWRNASSAPRKRERLPTRAEARAQAVAKAAHQMAALRTDGTKPSSTPNECVRKMAGHEEQITCLAWSPDSRQLASGAADKVVRLWELSCGGRCMHTLSGHRHEICAVEYSPDGRWLASAGEEGTVRVWSTENPSGIPPQVLSGAEGMTSLFWYHDSFHFMTCSTDKTVRIWNSWHGARERLLQVHAEVGFHLALSPDGTMFAMAGVPPIVRVFKESTGQELRSLEGHTENVFCLAWSPDSKLLATGARDTTVRVWEVASGKCRSLYTAHSELVTDVAWSPDGRMLVTVSDDRTLRVWDLSSGVCKRVLMGHTGEVTSVAWSPDGRYVATGSADRTIRVWR